MPIIHHDLEDFETFQERINRSFEEILLGIPKNPASPSRWIPAVDVYETDDAVMLCAELPGIDQDDVEVQVYRSSLVLKGKRHFPGEEKHENYHRIERSYGMFERYFTLPDSIDPQKITATFADGILTLTIPKAIDIQPRKIDISVT